MTTSYNDQSNVPEPRSSLPRNFVEDRSDAVGGNRSRKFGWLAVTGIAVGLVLGTFGDRLLTRLSYASDRDPPQATPEALASVESISNTFRAVARTTRPGVVHIAVSGGNMDERQLGALRQQLEEQFDREFSDEDWERFLREHRDQPIASGSGILFDAAGFILTNNHVVSGRQSFRVRLHDGREYEARLTGTDAKTDLAVLKIDAPDLHPLSFGDSSAMEVGDWVLAVGAPFGLEQSVTHGIISATGRNDVADVPIFYQDFLQTDAAINPGNSGGPLVNMRGEVIGVNTAIATRGDHQNAGVAFTIPSNMAKRIAEQLKSGGRVERGWLGVRLSPLTANDVGLLGLSQNHGVLVDSMYEDSPAYGAGLQCEDVIVGVDGRTVANLRALQAAIADVGPGRRTVLRVVRDGAEMDLPIVVGRQPENIGAFDRESQAIAARRATGLALLVRSMRTGLAESLVLSLNNRVLAELAQQQAERRGVFVVDFTDAAAARDYGVEPGDMVVAVNGTDVRSVAQLNAALGNAARSVRLQVVSADGRQRTVYIER